MKKVIILDDMAYIRYRVKRLLSNQGIEVYESSNSFDFFNQLIDKKDEINLIILEIGLGNEDGFEVLKKIRAKDLKIPIMILTKLSTRIDFIKCIKEGTSEYILKPFDGKILVDRIDKLLEDHTESSKDDEIIHLNFQEYMAKQISIAKKNKTNVSTIMMSLTKIEAVKVDKEKIDVGESYFFLVDSLYEKLKDLFKNSGLFEKYGFSTFVAVLPNCNRNKTEVLKKKIIERYTTLKKKEYKYENYDLNIVFVVYPEDGHEKQELLDKLTMKFKTKL